VQTPFLKGLLFHSLKKQEIIFFLIYYPRVRLQRHAKKKLTLMKKTFNESKTIIIRKIVPYKSFGAEKNKKIKFIVRHHIRKKIMFYINFPRYTCNRSYNFFFFDNDFFYRKLINNDQKLVCRYEEYVPAKSLISIGYNR